MFTVKTYSQSLVIHSSKHQHEIVPDEVVRSRRIKRTYPLFRGDVVWNLMHPEDKVALSTSPRPVRAFVVSDTNDSDYNKYSTAHPRSMNNQIVQLMKPAPYTPEQMLALALEAGHSKHAQVVAAVTA